MKVVLRIFPSPAVTLGGESGDWGPLRLFFFVQLQLGGPLFEIT
jgi:hypothetical protein